MARELGREVAVRRRVRGEVRERRDPARLALREAMSANRPPTRGRIALATNGPISAAHWPRRAETVKWFAQNQTRRSRNGASAVSAAATWACASRTNSARERALPGAGFSARPARSAASASARLGEGAPGAGARTWSRSQASRSQAAGSPGGGSVLRRPNPKRTSACIARSSIDGD
jgi:hypothetical protein